MQTLTPMTTANPNPPPARRGFPATNPIPSLSNPMTYRVEVHNGQTWAHGIRINDRRLPEFCSMASADQLSITGARQLRDRAIRLCGGTLRVKKVPVDA